MSAIFAGHTTRLLDDSATNGHTSQVTKNLRNTTPQSFPVSDSLVPLTLSGASKSSGSERAPEDNGASANSNLADNTGLSIPSVEIVQAHSMSPEGSTLGRNFYFLSHNFFTHFF